MGVKYQNFFDKNTNLITAKRNDWFYFSILIIYFYILKNDLGTMKNLIMMRHAKSDWTNPTQKDFERTLNARGHRVAPRMGYKLHELEVHPDAIVSSPAERTKLTAEYLAEQLNIETSEIVYDEAIYEASVRSLLEVVNHLDDDHDTVILIGHNPSFSYLAEYLSGEEIGNIPTCGVVYLQFEFTTWKEVSQDTGSMKWFIYPRKFDF